MSRIDTSRSVPHPAATEVRDDSPHDIQAHERAVLQAIRDTAYGTVEVTVHQSRIVQITRSEKLRL